ncbi:Diacylglycerol O-acyltransferase 2 (Acyl-CoA retinol O-fatty-acyltransferase) (ARAT) (Retinol O-fatty-acyltransferase) (Diglyceride acyltransferase 2) [Durusdinium trenchii]|uniref:Acyltransferase n=1 Tax=Durusdinium trenchii TaxID=1381693 RepID=A0ABP0QW13_9DINO
MGAHGLLEPDRVHSHRIGDGFGTSGVESSLGPSISWSSYLRGALAHSLVWGSLQVGALSPFITLALYHLQGPGTAVFFLSMAVLSVLVPFSHSPSFCRFYLGSAACVGGSTVWVPEKILQRLQAGGYLVCFHPHGILPLGFSFNGALRVKAEEPTQFLPESFNFPKDCNGVQAPVLWRVPFFAPALRMWDACTPATKSNMKKLLAAKTAFGIIPGGSEDVAIHEHGKENVYINSRYGFIKYALQHGYCLILAYTFGENDQYYSLSCLRPLNLWLVKRFGFVLPLFWGKNFCPLLPRGGGLNTVYGRVIDLPVIQDPTSEDLVKWHAIYVEELKAMFDQYKGQFGFGDRAGLVVESTSKTMRCGDEVFGVAEGSLQPLAWEAKACCRRNTWMCIRIGRPPKTP